VPNVGLLVQDRRAAVIFTSDTYVTDEIWQTASEIEKLRAIFVDVSYPDELEELAVASKHLTPRTLGSELRKLDRHIPVLAVHIKPSSRDDVVRQLALLNDPRVAAAEIGRVYEW
jgi:cAMP phosphodiesterase